MLFSIAILTFTLYYIRLKKYILKKVQEDFIFIGYNRRLMDSAPEYKGQWSDGRDAGVEEGVWAPDEPNITSGQCAYVGDPWDSTDTQRRWYMASCENVMMSVCERTPCPAGMLDGKILRYRLSEC